MELNEFVDDPIGEMDLTDLEAQDLNGGSWTILTTALTTFKHSICGTCGIFSVGCC